LPINPDKVIKEKDLKIGGIVTYQACSHFKIHCVPPIAAEWALTLPVAQDGEAAVPVHQDIFGSSAAAIADASPNDPPTGGVKLHSQLKTTVQQEQHSLLGWLALALLAGLILNVTPCVLPVISIKVLSFVQQASQSPARVFKL